ENLTAQQHDLVKKIDERLSANCKDPALLSRLAWVFHREGEKAKAKTLLDWALALKPAEPVVKRELAGVLGATGRHKEALAMYDGLPLVAEDRYRLAGLYSAVKDYRAAAEQCRALLSEKPNDPPTRWMLADVLSWDKKYRESLELFEQLLKESPGDEALKLRRAEVTLLAGNYDAALALSLPILEAKPDQLKLCPAFIDAAASAKTAPPATAPIALRIADGLLAGKAESATPLSRLAWILFRLKQKEKATALLDKALALRPVEPAVRKELAGVLAAVGRRQHALNLYRGLELEPDDRLRLAEMYAAEQKLDDAEREARAAVKARPDDRKSAWLLADILLWNRKYEEAGKLFRTLQEAEPNNPLLPQRLAELALWSGGYDEALDRFQKLLAGDFDQTTYWKSYVDAAASARKLNDDNKRTALHLYEAVRKNGAKDAVYLSRLAWVLRRSNEKEKAVELLRMALALAPESRPIRSELAETLYETGHYDEAEKHFSILLRSRPEGETRLCPPKAHHTLEPERAGETDDEVGPRRHGVVDAREQPLRVGADRQPGFQVGLCQGSHILVE